MVLKRTHALTFVADGLSLIKASCEQRGILGLFDNHKVAQHFFCQLLNAAYGLELVEMDRIQDNFPAIDLGDFNAKIAYQITATKRGDKVQNALDTFIRHQLNEKFTSLRILILGDRQQTYNRVKVPQGLLFSVDSDIIDIGNLLTHIATLDTVRIEEIQKILNQEMKFQSQIKLSPSDTCLNGLNIDIGVLREPPEESDKSETFTNDRVLRYVISKDKINDEQQVIITPQMDYLSCLRGTATVEAISYFYNPFKCQYPCLDITFVNNTGSSLAISEAVFEIAESVPDVSPVIVFKDDNAKMRLVIRNEGWGSVRNPVIKCNVLPTGALEIRPNPSIDHISAFEPYTQSFQLPDFEDLVSLDLESTFAALGVDLAAIQMPGFREQYSYVSHAMEHGLDKELWQHYGRFPDSESDAAWGPFPDGYAVVAGVLQYNDDVGAAYSLPFRVRVFLFQNKITLPRPPSYKYHIMLEPEGKKYEVFCPVSHSLQSGEVDRIHIRVGCLRSAQHKFRIRWRMNGGREVTSSPITLKHFVPKQWSKKRQALVEVGAPDGETQGHADPFQSMGCIEASILSTALMHQALRDQKHEK
ncbi:SMEK domain-containing protein [Fimbriiglobus ruber]|uniref:SMEK domain-containing protein n=1 Tax=Fimbriiglobus ruber TaxID=1908690 RepID=A0A225D1J8_9BACT|nr:SMEK domain-containing protein [Fimbriiglobus ruber]OWK35480.1 hypothetical protein FRUB_08043 [Fimbriiglobus ruber]